MPRHRLGKQRPARSCDGSEVAGSVVVGIGIAPAQRHTESNWLDITEHVRSTPRGASKP